MQVWCLVLLFVQAISNQLTACTEAISARLACWAPRAALLAGVHRARVASAKPAGVSRQSSAHFAGCAAYRIDEEEGQHRGRDDRRWACLWEKGSRGVRCWWIGLKWRLWRSFWLCLWHCYVAWYMTVIYSSVKSHLFVVIYHWYVTWIHTTAMYQWYIAVLYNSVKSHLFPVI
jgi:hypothetical protein